MVVPACVTCVRSILNVRHRLRRGLPCGQRYSLACSSQKKSLLEQRDVFALGAVPHRHMWLNPLLNHPAQQLRGALAGVADQTLRLQAVLLLDALGFPGNADRRQRDHNADGTTEARPWWKAYLVASGLTVAGLLLFAGALLLLMYGGQLSDVAVQRRGGGGFVALVWQVLCGLFVLGCVLAAFNLIYIRGPGVAHRRWRWLMPGTLSGVAIWLLGSFGLKLYLSLIDSLTLSCGSVGAVIVLLTWLYLSGIAVLVGVEVNSIVERSSD